MCSNLDITVVDPSQVLLNRIPNIGINKVRGNLPDNLGLDSNLRFGYIHLREVLHHVVGHNVEDSRELVAKSLRALSSHLDDNGYIMIHEIFYEGYIIPPLSRTLIFYLLDIQQNIKIPINSKEFLKGLRVCFYTRDEFKSLLASCGYKLMEYKIEYWANNWKKNALLINNWGRMMYIAKKL